MLIRFILLIVQIFLTGFVLGYAYKCIKDGDYD